MVFSVRCHFDGGTSFNYGRVGKVRGQKHSKYSLLWEMEKNKLFCLPRFSYRQYCSWRCWENICTSTIVKLPDPKAYNWKRLQKRTFGTKNAAVCKNAKFADHSSSTEFGSFLDRPMIWNILPIPKMIQKCHLASVRYWKLKNGNDILFPKGILTSKSKVWKSQEFTPLTTFQQKSREI